MITCYQANVVPSVMLYIVHHITPNFLVTRGRCTIDSFVNRCIKFQQFPHLCGFSFFPEIIPILLIDVHRLPMCSRYKVPKFPERFMLVCTCLGLVQSLAICRNCFHPSVSRGPCCLAYWAQVTGSSLAIKSRGSYVVSPVSHSTKTLYRDPL
jgi:hypothetical protein